MKPHQEDQAEAPFIAEEVEAGPIAAGYVSEPPGQARTASVCELFVWQANETLSEAVTGRLERCGTASGLEPRGMGV